MKEFCFSYLDDFFAEAKRKNYSYLTLKDYFLSEKSDDKTIVVRIDVDFDPLRVTDLEEILNKYAIKGSFFFRMHGKYNPFSFPVVKIIQSLVKNGHEVGVHTEVIDMERICEIDAREVLKANISMLESMYGIKVYGTASHGDHTGHNNLDFWKSNVPKDFGLLYEAYDDCLFKREFYVSDSQVSSWKRYFKGELDTEGKSDPLHLINTKNINFMYLLLHPDSFYKEHYHENIKY